ncbi:MAG: sortase [Anaerolineales bacterium]
MHSARIHTDKETSRLVNLLAGLGLLILLFALGKSLYDLSIPPRVVDLTSEDWLEEGFLPLYSVEGALADPSQVEISAPLIEPFPTPVADAAEPTPTPDPGFPPDRLVIASINLDAPVVPVSAIPLQYEGNVYEQWQAPNSRAAGWHRTSVGIGSPGNTVLNGHHNIYGEVFRDLYLVQVGDEIEIYSGDQLFTYLVVFTAVLPERNQPLEVRLSNAEWIRATRDERVTLITCWPYTSNTHRVVLVAVPLRDA